MNPNDPRFERFEELDAGRAMGDLDAVEMAEWEKLAEECGPLADPERDRLATALEIAAAERNPAELPPALAAKIRGALPAPSAPPEVGRRSSIVMGPWLGWAVAACLLGLLVIPEFLPGDSADPGGKRAALIERAPTDEAFAKLPEGTVKTLLKPENKEKLVAILTYHVVAGKVMAADVSTMEVATVEGSKARIKVAGRQGHHRRRQRGENRHRSHQRRHPLHRRGDHAVGEIMHPPGFSHRD